MLKYIIPLIIIAFFFSASAETVSSADAGALTVAAASGKDGSPDSETPGGKGADPEEAEDDTDAAGKTEEKARKQEIVRNAWTAQMNMLQGFRRILGQLDAKMDAINANLEQNYSSCEDETRRLMVLASTYKNWSNPMEAVNRSITHALADINELSAPLREGYGELKQILDRIEPIEKNLHTQVGKVEQDDDLKKFAEVTENTHKQIGAVLSRYETALIPFNNMTKRLEETQKDIAQKLPELWKSYYLQGPLPWLSEKAWRNLSHRMSYAMDGLKLRLPIELPITADQWRTVSLRFIISSAICLILGFAMYRRWFAAEENRTARHIFSVSLPWMFLGISLLICSVSATGDVFRVFLAVGNLCAIVGITLLAWDMRCYNHPEVTAQASPLLRLMPLTFAAYILLYLPLIRPILLVAWLACLSAAIVWRRFWPPLSISPLQMEKYVRSVDVVVLWICLFLALGGLHIISMIFYLLFTSICLAVQVSLGGIGRINYLNEHLPTEGIQAVLASLLVALAAPLMLVTAFISVLLWIGTLPGGMVLMQEYFFKSIRVGSTQFSFLSVLVIISLFFLTRAAVIMGTRFLKRLPKHGLNIDSSLIQPAQTAFTYTAWTFFGLFVLHSLGMELSNLAMVAGGLSVGIGFGMQTIVSNFVSGLFLIFGRMLQVGDIIEVAGVTGRVRRISIRDTLVETYDNAMIYIPNSEFISKQLVNWTRNNPTVRLSIPVGVAYGTDTGLVMKTLISVATGHPEVLKRPEPSVAFRDFGDSTLDFVLYCWVAKYDAKFRTATELRLEIERRFRKEQIEIAFPQMDIHIQDQQPDPGKGHSLGNNTARNTWRRTLRKSNSSRVLPRPNN